MIANLLSPADVAAARTLIEGCGLAFEPPFDDLVGIHEQGRLVAVGARAGRVLKMLAIDPAYRGGSLLGEIVGTLVARGIEAGFDALFVFTKPGYAGAFAALNFALLATGKHAVLLEFGNGLKRWLAARSHFKRAGLNGALTVSGEPFSPDHRQLIERAARRVDRLYVFISAADRSPLAFPERWQRVRDGVGDLANVVVLDLGHYRIVPAGFPTYFLKADDPVATIRAELDATLFATQIAPFFGIVRCFTGAGSMPEASAEKKADEAAMTAVFPAHGIAVSAISNPPPGDRQ